MKGRIFKYLEIRHKKHLQDWDTVICIAGEEGGSKSNLAEHLLEWWQTKINGKCVPEDIKHMCLTKEDFVKDLSDSIPMEMTIFDEAGELDSRRAMSKFNVMLSQAYKVIRADRLFTVLVLPEFFDLESRFRNRRVKGLFYVYQRGKVAFWGRKKLRLLCALNENRMLKNYFVVKPDFYDTFPIYKGTLADQYEILKTKKTKEARENLVKEITNPQESIRERLKQIVRKMKESNYTNVEIAKFMDVTNTTVATWLKESKTKG